MVCFHQVFVFFLVSISLVSAEVEIIVTDCQTVELDYHLTTFTLRLSEPCTGPITVELKSEKKDIAFPLKTNFTFLPAHGTVPQVVFVFGNDVGTTHIDVIPVQNNKTCKIKSEKVQIIVVHSMTLKSLNAVIGWVYFIAWSISFYPQVFENFKRKSVIGLNFDFLCYNLTGFIAYSFFNVNLFWIKEIQDQYFDKYGGSVIPVQPNDVFFALHAVIITIITIVQCLLFERGNQKVSIICRVLTAIAWTFAIVSLIPACMHKISWLTYLDFFSYIKLGVTLIKYIPQAVMNYKRKSTVGWSIGNVLLDFTGGSMSLVQMFLIAYNNNEWNSIFGDLTKFGLGFFSVLFDILFMTQHYVLYRVRRDYTPIEGEDRENMDHSGVVNKPVLPIV